MISNRTTGRLNRIALILMMLFSAAAASAASAQTPQEAGRLEAALAPGTTVWITDSSGREERARIHGVSGNVLTTTGSAEIRRLGTPDVVRVRVRESDPLLNGAVIGAGAAVAS